MAEANERLARVETHLSHLSEQQDKMSDTIDAIKESNLRLATAVEKFPALLNDVLAIQRESVGQDKRITQLEHCIEAQAKQWLDQTKVNRRVEQTTFRMNLVWSAIAALSVAVISALVRAYMNGSFS